MKTLITKSDGTPTKSKVHALQFLDKNGISKDCLIEENGQFFYEAGNTPSQEPPTPANAGTSPLKGADEYSPVTWDVPVFDKNNEKTKLFIPGTDVIATINGKHPAGQLRPKSAFEINIGNENFIMSLDLVAKIFKVRG